VKGTAFSPSIGALGLVGAPCFSRGEQRFSFAQRSSTLIMRFSAGLENPGLKSLRENYLLEPDWSKLGSTTSFCFVSGHDFGRATLGQNGQGFSPCHRKIGAEIPRERGTGAKAQLFFAPFTARLKSCPDTKRKARCKA
jgi:hypothetical protein